MSTCVNDIQVTRTRHKAQEMIAPELMVPDEAPRGSKLLNDVVLEEGVRNP